MQMHWTLGIVTALWSCASVGVCGEPSGRTIDLFTASGRGEGQAAWTAYCEHPQTDAERIWQLRDGVLTIQAGPRGYVRTREDFTDFVLRLKWRRPVSKKPGAAGVLIRMTGQDKIWPKCLEAQLNAGSAGDFWGLDGYQLSGPPERLNRVPTSPFGSLTNLKKVQDAEKPGEEWNQYEIIAEGATVTLKINGHLVNRATECDVVPGKICLTAEGDEIDFRQVQLSLP